jgi:hypothetical protein
MTWGERGKKKAKDNELHLVKSFENFSFATR